LAKSAVFLLAIVYYMGDPYWIAGIGWAVRAMGIFVRGVKNSVPGVGSRDWKGGRHIAVSAFHVHVAMITVVFGN